MAGVDRPEHMMSNELVMCNEQVEDELAIEEVEDLCVVLLKKLQIHHGTHAGKGHCKHYLNQTVPYTALFFPLCTYRHMPC